ncbi:hypothetical protein [Streptomyces longisporoflavus]|uniref:Uncharacterized protein n=1 Tax=Streptomyces longisporoflavus TaxID=28044 RepID=A0ABW7R2H8_9ACTN
MGGELIGPVLLAALEQRFTEDFLPPCEAQAIVHPNGFVKLPLARTADGVIRFFLHVWRSGSEDAAVHDHRWPFASVVLGGELAHTMMDVAVTSGGVPRGGPDVGSPGVFDVARYRPGGGEHCFDLSRRERAVISHRRRHVFPVGQSYGMEAFAFHRARASAGAMTFVARGLPQRPYARVLVEQGGFLPPSRRWRLLEAPERRQYLRDALEVLG